ncbi:MAG TPA: TIGR02597 family protein, partial [Verrucomicrobiae bacterium]|nr:TIGR02597 family protein [Verrucomicrobiae bacterium]
VNLSASRTYYFFNGSWRQAGQGSAVKNDDVVLADMFLWVRQNSTASTTLNTCGSLVPGKWKMPLHRQGSGGQDNFVALPRLGAVSLGESGLVESGAFQPSASAGTRLDELLVFDNTVAEQNKSASATYYYWNGAWHKVGAGSTVMDAEQVFKPGSGCILRLGAGTPVVWTNNSVP